MTTPPQHPVPDDFDGNIDDGLHKMPEEPRQRDVLVGGIKIGAVDAPGNPGSIGCFLRDRRDPNAVYLLTVLHLWGEHVQAAQVPPGTKVGQPDGKDGTCSNDVIGTFVTGDGVGVLQDEALIRLKPGIKWSPQIDGIGPITLPPGDNGTGTGGATATLDGTYKVMKWGFRTGGTGGRVLPDAAHSPDPNDPNAVFSFSVRLVVEPRPNGGALHVAFVQQGDSGSAVLNAERQVVGLVTGKNKFGHGVVLPINQVLDRLNGPANNKVRDLYVVTTTEDPAPVFTVQGGAMVPVPRELEARLAADPEMAAAFRGEAGRAPVGRPWFTDIPPRDDAFERLRDDLAAIAAGRFLFALWERHRPELTGLLTSDRRLMLVWHRGGGAALVQLMLRMLTHPDQPLPETLHGEPLMACLDRAYAEVRRCASPGLRADLARARSLAPDLAGLDYQGILDALAATPAEEMTAHA